MPPRSSKSKTTPPVVVAAPAAPVAPVAPVVQRSEAKGSGSRPVSASPIARVITRDQIAKRAYEIYANRGYAAGDQTADWLEAERQLKAGL